MKKQETLHLSGFPVDNQTEKEGFGRGLDPKIPLFMRVHDIINSGKSSKVIKKAVTHLLHGREECERSFLYLFAFALIGILQRLERYLEIVSINSSAS